MLPSLFALFARRKCLGVLSFLLFIGPPPIYAQSWQFAFARVTDGYRIIGRYPTLESGRIAFAARGPDDVWGIHAGPLGGPYTRVVDEASVIAGTATPLGSIVSEFGFDDGRIAFYGGQGAYRGIYLFDDGVINPVAIPNTPMPSSTRSFSQFSWPPTMNDGRVVFSGQSGTIVGVQPLRGVYLARDGELSRIADTTMPIPGEAGNFTSSFQIPVIEGAKIAFVGNWPERSGIYLHDLNTGVQSRVVDNNTPVPGHAGTFGFFDAVDLDDERVAFIHRVSATGGVYVADIGTGSLTTIAETGMAIPGTESMQFDAPFASVSIDEGRVAFGYSTGGIIIGQGIHADSESEFYGVYSNLPGSLAKVIATGDMLDGKVVFRTHVERQGLQGNQILTDVWFQDDTQALYVATLIPEPATLVLLVSACLAFAVMSRLHRFSKVRMLLRPANRFVTAA